MKKYILFLVVIVLFFNVYGQSNSCTSPTPITMNSTCIPTSGTTVGATQTIAGCVGNADDDVWYQFTATASAVQIIVTPGDASFDPVVQLFSGGCGTLLSLSCTDNGLGGDTEIINYNGLTIGQTYRIRVYHYFTGSGSGNFTICVKDAPAPPINDDCGGAISLNVNTSCLFTTATTHGASESQVGCAGNADDDVWFSFTATNSVQNILVNPIDNLDLVFQVFSGSCGSLTPLHCEDNGLTNDNEQSDIVGLVPGATYFVRVYDYYGGVTGDFNICITGAPTPAPTNDEPCNAIALPAVTSECQYGFYTTTGATTSTGAPVPSGCVGGSPPQNGGYSAGIKDVWFTVTVPATGSIDIIPQPNGGAGTITDGVVALYSGTCTSLTQIACSDDYNYPGSSNDLLPLITANGLTPGSTVYIRYWGWGSSFGDFGICVTTTSNDECANALYICDPNGYSGSTSPAYTPDRPDNMHGNNETSAGVNLPNGTDSGGPFGDGQPWDMSYPFNGSPFLDVNIENNSWIRFTASAPTVTLDVSIYDCWVGNYPSGGMQMQIFEATNCTNFVPVSNFAESSTGFTITANSLTVGQDYYLMIDGYAGDICNYTITANSGVQFPDITPNPAIVCPGGSITLTAPTGATSYYWPHSNETTQSVVVTPPTTQTYTCEVTGLCNYKQTLTALVTVTAPSASAGSDVTICQGTSTTISGTASSGTPSYSFTWDNGLGTGQSHTVSPLSTTTYTVTVTDAIGCTDTDQVTVTVNPTPNITSVTNDPTTCGGTDGNIVINGTGTGTVSWTGTSSGTSGTVTLPYTITNLSAGSYTIVFTSTTGCTSNTLNETLTEPSAPPQPTITASGPTTFCSGQSVTLTSSASLGNTWSTGATTPSITVTTSGTYTVTQTVSGCSSTSSPITVTVNPLPPVTASASPTSICSGDNSTLSASGASTYTWDNGLGAGQSHTVTPASTTTYTVTGIDANGCTNTSSVAITVNLMPNITSVTNDPTTCGGTDGNIVINGTGTGTVSWTGTSSGTSGTVTLPYTITNLSAGSYTIVFTSTTGCTSNTLNETLTEPSAPPQPTITASGPTTFCSGQSVTLTSSASLGNTWSTGATTPSITVTTSGTYTVTQTVSGCSSTSSPITVTVNPLPPVTASASPTSICSGDNSTLTASGATTYTWDNGLGAGQSHTVTPTSTTTYTVTGTDANGCTNTSSVAITVNPTPTVTASASPMIICVGESATLTGGGAMTYTWDNALGAGQTHTVSPTSTTTYTVTGTDANGCTGLDQVTITVNPMPSVIASGNNLLCEGENLELYASPNGMNSYSWTGPGGFSSSEQSPVINNVGTTNSGTYTVTVSAPECSLPITQTVDVTVNPTPIAIAGTDTSILIGQSVMLSASGGGSYQWIPADYLDCSTCPNPVVTPEKPGTMIYCVEVTNTYGCLDTACVKIEIDCGELFIPNTFSPNNDGNNDFLCIYGHECLSEVNFLIFNRWGELVYRFNAPDDCWDGTFKGKELNTATFAYTLQATTLSGEIIKKRGNITLLK